MTHINMHQIKREPQGFATDRITPGQNGVSATNTNTLVLTDAGSQTALASLTRTIVETIKQPVTTFVTTRTAVLPVTNSAEYSSLLASQSSASAAQATHSTSKTSSASASTSSTASKDSSSNLGTLIPAIVAPVAAVLIISFVIFWFIMRRRHQRQLKEEPQFVMASKPEKAISRGNSNSSGHSSTRELVPMSKLEKEVSITTSEMRRSSLDMFPPKYSSADIGVARPMTPPDKASQALAMKEKSFTNFSSVRPGTSHKSRPSQDKRNPGRSRGNSASVQRGIPPLQANGRNSPAGKSRGPPPGVIRAPGPPPPRPLRPDESDARAGAVSPSRGPPPPLATNMNHGNRAAPPKPLNPPTPTGAFNGASPISQYSPIVKGQFNLGAVAASDTSDPHHNKGPLAVKTHNLAPGDRTDSPTDENVLSYENMRIARLANSSRLGFNKSPVEPSFPSRGNSNNRALSPLAENQTRTEQTTTSPRLPPPLTRDDMPPKLFIRGLDSPAGGSSIYPSPSIGVDATPRIGAGPSVISLPHSERTIGVASSNAVPQRDSIVSRISSDDEYVDMDVDAKSDVSSLDDRDTWEVESDQQAGGGRLGTGYNGSGYGSVGMSPVDGPAGTSSAGTGTTKPGLRDRDSEGPFVLSRY